jgi:CheY-like chemotaxis protein
VLFMPTPESPVAIGKAARSRPDRTRTRLGGRVLVVDDEQMVGQFMSDLLQGWGLDVTVKSSPIEARELFMSNPSGFDVVITDQTMPRLTGIELARELLAARPDLPIILYTGYSDVLTPGSAEQAGVRALVKKPVEPAALLSALRANLPRDPQTASRA